MQRCIYCLAEKEDECFNREHVMPESFGTFENAPVLHGTVCMVCNSEVFQLLEHEFKEDTDAGVFCQMFSRLIKRKPTQARLRGKNTQLKKRFSMLDDFFSDVFPFFVVEDDRIKVAFIPQVIVQKPDFLVYIPIDVLVLARTDTKLRKRLESILTRDLERKDIKMFGGADSLEDGLEMIRRIAAHLAEYGIEYVPDEAKNKYNEVGDVSKQHFEMSYQVTLTQEAGRVLAKIAFNYFAKCAQDAGNVELVFEPYFNRLRAFIMGDGTVELKDVITNVEQKAIIKDLDGQDASLVAHVINFEAVNGDLIAKMCFFSGTVFTINMGKVPAGFDRAEFGCGHAFFPIDQKICPISANPARIGDAYSVAKSFGLLNRL